MFWHGLRKLCSTTKKFHHSKIKIMKTLFVTLTVLFSLFSNKSRADEVKVSDAVMQSFTSTFQNASEVKWSTNDQFYKAEFFYNSQYVSAYFDTEGKLVVATRNISSFELPVTLQTSLKKECQNAWISSLVEVSDESGTGYYVVLETADKKIV